MKRGSSRITNRCLTFIMGLVLSAVVVLSIGCVRSVGTIPSQSTPILEKATSKITIKNTTMFELNYVIVKRSPIYRASKDLLYAGWLNGDAEIVIRNVSLGQYYFVFKIGYRDDVMIHEFVVNKKPQIITISDVNKRFRVGG